MNRKYLILAFTLLYLAILACGSEVAVSGRAIWWEMADLFGADFSQNISAELLQIPCPCTLLGGRAI